MVWFKLRSDRGARPGPGVTRDHPRCRRLPPGCRSDWLRAGTPAILGAWTALLPSPRTPPVPPSSAIASKSSAAGAFLVLREDDGAQRLIELTVEAGDRVSIGRGIQNDVALPWDTEVSRLHAELECIGGEWTVSDDGLSRNGTYVNGMRISGRQRLRDGDTLRVGRTTIAYRRPETEDSRPTQIAGATVQLHDLTPTQRAVLVALARPYKVDEFATPAPNQAIADELHLSVDAVKGTCARSSPASGSSTCRRTRSARGSWPRPCNPGW